MTIENQLANVRRVVANLPRGKGTEIVPTEEIPSTVWITTRELKYKGVLYGRHEPISLEGDPSDHKIIKAGYVMSGDSYAATRESNELSHYYRDVITPLEVDYLGAKGELENAESIISEREEELRSARSSLGVSSSKLKKATEALKNALDNIPQYEALKEIDLG